MTKQEALPVRFVLVTLGFMALLSQTVLLPRIACEYAAAYPQVAYLAVPYASAAIVALVCFQAALFGIWHVLAAGLRGRAKAARPAAWANVTAVSLALAGLIIAAICAHAGAIAAVGGPAMLFGGIAGLLLIPAAKALQTRLRQVGAQPDPDGRGLVHSS